MDIESVPVLLLSSSQQDITGSVIVQYSRILDESVVRSDESKVLHYWKVPIQCSIHYTL